jgi:hypothetical protein
MGALPGTFLTSTTINQSAIKEGDWNTFDFPDITVTSGNTYYLVMLCSDADMMWLASTANPYAGGQHYYSFSSSGASWSTNSSFDHLFRIYDSVLSTVPLTKSKAWQVRMEVKDTNGQTTQTVRDIWTNAYDTPPTVSLNSSTLSGTTATTFNLTATGADANSATVWDGLVNYRWGVNGDGNFETEFAAANTNNATFSQPGTYQATVEVRDRYHATARASVMLTVNPVSGPTQLSINGGNNQTGPINITLATPPSVVVRDAANNPVSGVLVVFRVLSGGGTVTNSTQITNAAGIATLGSWTLGSAPGADTLTALIPNSPEIAAQTFTATAVSSSTLTVSKSGTGSGTVTSSPAGIDCGLTCAFSFTVGTMVTLTATPDMGNSFISWSGADCSGSGTCQVTMDVAKGVTARFDPKKRPGQITSN